MKQIITAVVTLALAGALGPPAVAAKPPVPQRSVEPTPSLLDDLEPNEGVARMRCKASADGMLSGCTVLAELPAQVGVGDAALRQVAANPHLAGTPAGGGVIEANFRVALTAEQIAAKPAQAAVIYSAADWLRKPSAAQVTNAYPARAQEEGVSGYVVLSCTVSGTGAVGPCIILRETPPGMGFGDAAQQITRVMQMRPKKVAGIPVSGTATIPVRFETDPGEPTLTCVAEIC